KEKLARSHDQAVRLLSRSLSNDQVRFLVDRVKDEFKLQEALFALIEQSKGNPDIGIASANAATLLNACRIQFVGLDMKKVQLGGADLRYGAFIRSDLSGANLRQTKLARTQWHKV